MDASHRRTLACALAVAGLATVGCRSGGAVTTEGSDDAATATAASNPATTATATAPGTATEAQRGGVRLRQVVSGVGDALFVTGAPGQSALYVVQQSGTIRTLNGGRLGSEPFLDVSDLTQAGGERGLLGLAFDPGYAQNRRFYIDYTDRNGDTRVARYTADASGTRANPQGEVILTVRQPYANHNGGMLAFGPDGMLYVGLGDGGSGGDPENRAQNLSTMLGKILRLDVSGATGYTVPTGNPFRSTRGARPEIWHYGVRNPWRFSFDRGNGDMWIGDVGQNAIEEIDRAPRGRGGLNFGWNAFEGRSRFGGPLRRGSRPTPPVTQYTHAKGISVTGGYVYRGTDVPALRGRYVFADYGSGRVWSLRAGARPGGLREETGRLGVKLGSVTSFGEGQNGDLYVIANQNIYRFTR